MNRASVSLSSVQPWLICLSMLKQILGLLQINIGLAPVCTTRVCVYWSEFCWLAILWNPTTTKYRRWSKSNFKNLKSSIFQTKLSKTWMNFFLNQISGQSYCLYCSPNCHFFRGRFPYYIFSSSVKGAQCEQIRVKYQIAALCPNYTT